MPANFLQPSAEDRTSTVFCLPMRSHSLLFFVLTLALAACSSPARKLPKYEKPISRTRFQNVRTTAYTHSESDHLVYGRKSAMGNTLRSGTVNSAAADWARWPAGTVFRICSTGEIYQVDDYGWALTGRNTIDLYKPSRSSMNSWGLRYERIEVLRWGDAWASYKKMKPAANYAHVAQMMRDIKRFHSGASPVQPSSSGPDTPTVALVRQPGE
jgi:3D (Asp-Asp-Asp) domain-containing protein